MTPQTRLIGVLILVLILLSRGGGSSILSPEKITQATYVYDDTPIPLPVRVAFNQLNREGIVANPADADDTSSRFAIAIPAAREKGLPAIVVQSGEKVLRVITEVPTSIATIVEAVKGD